MLTRDKLMRALEQANVTAKSILAQGCTTDRGIAAQDAQRAVQEADEYLAAGDMLEAYGLFCQRETVREPHTLEREVPVVVCRRAKNLRHMRDR
jgi:hypothetical protein